MNSLKNTFFYNTVGISMTPWLPFNIYAVVFDWKKKKKFSTKKLNLKIDISSTVTY